MILILGSIIFPLVTHGINCTSDVYTAVSSKNEIVKLCSAIDYCYYSGKGSKKLVYLNFNKNTVIKLSNENNLGLATSKINLSQNSSKYFRIYLDCPFINEEIKFSKGFNKIVVEWPENSDYILLVH